MNNIQTITQAYQFPRSFSYQQSMELIGNTIHVGCARYFLEKVLMPSINSPPPQNIKFLDLFCGIGGFHLALNGYGKCVLASDNNKNCQAVYQLNFPNIPFLLGDINNEEVQKRIIKTNFNLLCAGFPCQPYSKANTSHNKKDTVISSLLKVIEQKKPKYLFLENVPQLIKYPVWKQITKKLIEWNYQIYWERLNPKDLGWPVNRPRLFIWGELKNYE